MALLQDTTSGDAQIAMVLRRPGEPLGREERRVPEPGPGQVRVRVAACGVCRTDLHVVDGELPDPALPVVPGHEIVGRVDALGSGVEGVRLGDRVGVPWLAWTCGACSYCRAGRENLCREARFHGYTVDGGYARYVVADARYAFPIPAGYGDVEAAPLLCAGLIGMRSLRMAGAAERLGLYGFGAAAHIVAQVARARGQEVYAFVRPGDDRAKAFARRLGAVWAGDSTEAPPVPLDAAILYAPVGHLVPAALQAIRPGGRVVCAGIHMSDIPSFPYRILWEERCVQSVANLTRADGLEMMRVAATTPIHTEVTPVPLERANEALADLRAGRVQGALVLV